MDDRRRARLLVAMLFFVNVAFNFEAAMAEFLLPVVAEALTVPVEQSQIILYTYYLAIIVMLALSLTSKARALARVPGLVLGGGLFAAGSFLLGITIGTNLLAVVMSRLLQGAGVALIVAATPALIVHWRLSEHMRVSPFALIPVSIGVGMLAGPTLGALAAEQQLIPVLYFGTTAVTVAMLIAVTSIRMKTISVELPPMVPVRCWDFDGLLATGLVLCSLFVVAQSVRGETHLIVGLVISAALMLAAWLLFERSDQNSDHPIFDIHFLVRDTRLVQALMMNALSFAGTYVVAYVLPFYIYYEVLSVGNELRLGGTIVFVPLGFIFGPLLFEAIARSNIKRSLWSSAYVFFAALAAFALANWSGNSWWLLLAGAALGAARGIFVSPYNKLTLNTVPVHRIDEVSAYNSISRYSGMAIGTLVGSAFVVLTSELQLALMWALLAGVAFMTSSMALVLFIKDEEVDQC